MYRPNFCCECGEKTIRLRWRAWHSRRFCNKCVKGRLKERLVRPAILCATLLCFGFMAGRAGRPAPPPLIIQRSASSPLLKTPEESSQVSVASDKPVAVQRDVYLCGARTKKGAPCSRRVHGEVRCWQHTGMKAMLTAEKLKVK